MPRRRVAYNARSATASFQVGMLLVTICFVFHWVACGWIMVGDQWCMYDRFRKACPGLAEGRGGLDKLTKDQRRKIYALSLWQGASNFFGGADAETVPERLYFVFVCIVGAVLQAVLLGSFANVIKSLNQEFSEHQQTATRTLSWMQMMHLPEELQDRVLMYYEKLWQYQRTVSLESDIFTAHLTPSLQLETRMSLFRDMMLKLPFLKDLTPPVVEEMVRRLKLRVYMKGDFLMNRGDVGDWMGLVSRGVCAGLDPERPKQVLFVLKVGANVGEASMFSKPRSADVIALTWVNLQILKLTDWRAIESLYPEQMGVITSSLQAKYDEMQSENTARKPSAVVPGFQLMEIPREGAAVELLNEAREQSGQQKKSRSELQESAVRGWSKIREKVQRRGTVVTSDSPGAPPGQRASIINQRVAAV